MQQPHCRWQNTKPERQTCTKAKASCGAAWKGTVSRKWEVPSRLSFKSALLFIPPTPLTAHADCENYHCTSWSTFNFHMGSKILGKRTWIVLPLCCSIRIIIHSLSLCSILDKTLCGCNQAVQSIGSWSHFKCCFLTSQYLLPHGVICWFFWSLSSEHCIISMGWLRPWWTAPFPHADVVLSVTNATVKRLINGCFQAPAPSLLWLFSASDM